MIGYITLGTNDLARAAGFYDELLAELGAGRALQEDNFVTWISEEGSPMLGLIKPFDDQRATVGNGVMVALSAESREQVDTVYRKALALGGQPMKALQEPGGTASMWVIFATWMATSWPSTSPTQLCLRTASSRGRRPRGRT